MLLYGMLSILFRKWLSEYMSFYKGRVALVFGILLIFLGILGFVFVILLPSESDLK